MLTLDYTVSITNILTAIAVLGSVMALLYSMKGDITIVKHDIRYLQEAFVQLGKVLTQVAVQDQRINMLEKRVEQLPRVK